MLFGELLENWGDVRRGLGRVRLLVYIGVAIALMLVGPFGTGSDPWLWRLFYWAAVIAIMDRIILPGAEMLVRRWRVLREVSATAGLAAMPFVVAIPMTAVVIGIDAMAAPLICNVVAYMPAEYAAQINAACATTTTVSALAMYGSVLAICFLTGGVLFLGTGGMKAFDGLDMTPVRPGLRFLSRLPAHIGADMRYVQMQDHYLRVVTRGGEAMILMSLRDALAELEGLDGMQVHRSWWIALNDVTQIVREGRKTFAIMGDDARIPVSDTYRTALRDRMGLGGPDASAKIPAFAVVPRTG